MKEEIKRKLVQMVSDIEIGLYGVNAKFELEKSQNTLNVISYYVDFIKNLYNPPEDDIELYQIGQRINEYILIIYRDSKIKDRVVADAMFKSLFDDFPNTQNTNLFDSYNTLIVSAIAFKNSIITKDKSIQWTLSKALFESYNEFLSGLIGYINLCAKAALGKRYNPSILHNSYKSKLDEFNSIGLNFLFHVITNIAKPELRNAISHSRISINNNNDEILYSIKIGKDFLSKKISLIEFIGIASAGTYLALGYITAITTILVIEISDLNYLKLLPDDIKSIFHI